MRKTRLPILLALLLVGCEKLEEIEFPLLLGDVVSESLQEATVIGEVLFNPNDFEVLDHGHCWALDNTPTIDNENTSFGPLTQSDTFFSIVPNLRVNQIYLVRPYAMVDNKIGNTDVIYGNTSRIITQEIIVTTDEFIQISPESATFLGVVRGIIDGLPVDEHGHCWSSTNPMPTVETDFKSTLGSRMEDGDFLTTVDNLANNTKYYVRSYIQLGDEIIYGDTTSFIIEDIWQRKADLPGMNRGFAASFVIGNKGYLAGGLVRVDFTQNTFSDQLLDDMWAYDPSTNLWEEIPNFPLGQRAGMYSFVLDGKAYIGGGINESNIEQRDLFRFDPQTKTWEQLDDFDGTARKNAFSFVLDGKAYIGCGASSTGLLNDVWQYDPTLEFWLQLRNFNGGPVQNALHFVVNGQAYVGGGDTDINALFIAPAAKNDLWVFDPISENWTQTTNLPGKPRTGAFATVIDQKVYLGMGLTNANSNGGQFGLKDFWAYDPSHNSWTPLRDFEDGNRVLPVAWSIQNQLFITTGLDAAASWKNDLWTYIFKK